MDWYDVSTQAVIIIVLAAAFIMVGWQILKTWFNKKIG
jgi:hypothetical protein